MKAATSTINRKKRTGPKARSAPQITEPGVAREYQAIFTNNGKPMVIVEADTTIFMANAEFERLSGYTKKEIEGKKKWTEFVARGDRKRMREYHLLRKSDPMLTPRCCEFRFLDRHGKITNVVITIGQIPGTNKSMASLQDVTDRRRAEATQRVSEKRYKTLFENSRDAVYITAPNGAYIDANPAALALFGYTKEAMKKVKAQQLYANPADARRLQKEIEKKGFAQDFEARLRKKDGKEMDCLLAVTAQRANDGSIVEYQYIVRDITERKKEEETLRESEEKYRTILETMHDAYFELDLAGTFTFVNDAACRHLGYTKEELIGMNNRAYTSPEAAEKIYEIFNAVYKEGKSTKVFDYEAIRKDGTTITLELSVSLVRDAKGKPIGFRGVSRDITERKQAEEALRESEEKYRNILASIQEGYFETDLDGNYTFVNDANCRFLGYTREELIGMNYKQHTEEEVVKKLYPQYRELYETGKPIESLEFAAVRKDGRKVIYETSVSLMRDSTGKPIGIRGVSRDITERKLTEDILRQSEEKYRTILENVTEGYFENDLQGNLTFFNESLPKVYGYTKDELLHMNYRQYMDEENAARVYQAYNKIHATGKPNREIQFEITRKDGTKRYIENSVSLMRDADGQPVGFQGIVRDVTERKQIEETLRESEERYRSILTIIGDAYNETDLAGKTTFLSHEGFKFLDYSEEEFVGMGYKDFTTPESAKKHFEIYNKVYRTGQPARLVEFELIAQDGTPKIVESTVELKRDKSGKPIGFRSLTRDITERKQMEEDLRQREERYRTILETMWDGYWETDLTGTFTFVNDAQCRMTESPRERLLGMNNRQYTDEATAKKLYEVFSKVYKTGEPIKSYEFEYGKRDGTKAFNEISVSLIRDAQGKPIGFRGVSRDITDRKQMEENLRQSEERYRTIIETIEDGYYEIDLAGHLTFINDAICRHLGYSKEELIGTNGDQYQDEAAAKKTHKFYKEIYETGKPLQAFEVGYIRKDGTKGIYELSVSLIRDAQGKPIGFRGISRDVTERKQMEEALRQSEERYRTILEEIKEGYFELDLDGNYTFANEANCKYLGYTKEQLIGMNARRHTDEETAKKVYQLYYELYRTGKPIEMLEVGCIKKDGTKAIYETSVFLMKDAEGKRIGFRGVSRDITDRKQMEENLRQSEERYRNIVETMQEAYYEIDLAGNYTFINDALCRNFGYTKEELIGTKSLQYQDEANAKKTYHAFKEIYRTGEPLKALEVEYSGKDGTKGTFELSASLIRDAQGKPIGFRGITYDVTERKQMEEALRQSEERHRTIVDTMQDGYWETDLTGAFTFVNDATCRQSGSPRERLIGRSNRQYTDEANAKKLYEAFNKIYKTGEPLKKLTYEYTRKDGTKAFNEITAALIRDAEGKPIGFRGISHDITELKLAEEKLRQSEERYRTIIETIQDGYYEIDLANHFTFVNDVVCRHLGYSKEELIGKKTQQYQNETEAKKSHKAFKAIYETGEPLQAFEVEYISKDGTKRIYELSASLIRDTQGKPIGFRGISRDITERKQMEETLKLRLKQLGALSRASQVVTATLAIDDVLQEIVSLANNAVGSDYTGVVLVDESGNLIRSADNVPGIPSIERRIREKGFTHWISHSHKALIIDEIGEDGAVVSPADLDEGVPRFADIKLVEAGVKSLAGLPLLAKGRLLGVLYLHGVRPHVFKGQLGLLTAFANQAAIAIENARLFEEAQNELAERKRAEEHLQRYAAELERSNEEVKNFAYIVSHDLRVPLVNLKGYTSELQSALGVIGTHFDATLPHLNDEARSDVAMALHEDVPEALEFITNSVSRMDGFINAVLILSRLGRRELKPEPIDMNALVQTVLEPLSYQIQEREIAVTVDSLPEVVADRTSMEQIVGNILGNAVKYLDPDRPAEIEINAERNHQETIFRIRDTGRGIAQEDMHKVFAPFRRAGKQDTPGEGMGLAYVQTLVRRHGGRIWCESELGNGTTFTFTIANPSRKGAQDV